MAVFMDVHQCSSYCFLSSADDDICFLIQIMKVARSTIMTTPSTLRPGEVRQLSIDPSTYLHMTLRIISLIPLLFCDIAITRHAERTIIL